jgi:hypothetical protein
MKLEVKLLRDAWAPYWAIVEAGTDKEFLGQLSPKWKKKRQELLKKNREIIRKGPEGVGA